MGKFFNEYSLKNNVDSSKNINDSIDYKTISDSDNFKFAGEKQYKHFDTEEMRIKNIEKIENYNLKKIWANESANKTLRNSIEKYGHYIGESNIKRVIENWSDSKIEIINRNDFDEKTGVEITSDAYTTAYRDPKDGSISVRDVDIYYSMSHSVTHEVMHDLSFQFKDIVQTNKEGIAYFKEQSGLRIIENDVKYGNEGAKFSNQKIYNNGLNEGFTELFTQREIKSRNEDVKAASYIHEVNWAIQLESLIGDDLIKNAYFGGDVDSLRNKINSMSSFDNAWEQLNWNIDEYARTQDISYKKRADYIIDDLEDRKQKVLIKKR